MIDENARFVSGGYFTEDVYNISLNFRGIKSNRIIVTVKHPEGENLVTFEKFKELAKLPYSGLYPEKYNSEVLFRWVQFLNASGNSIYYANIFKATINKRIYSENYLDSSTLVDCELMIEKYSDSILGGGAVNAASMVLNKISNKEGKIEFFEKIIRKYPLTVSSLYAAKLLKREKNKQ